METVRAGLLVVLLTVIESSAAWAVEVGAKNKTERSRSEIAVVESYLPKVESRLIPRFEFAGVHWPPKKVTLVAFKESRRMELWAEGSSGQWRFIRDYRLKGLSGETGPKLKQGDRQVPEGFYRIEALNPHSRFHLSLKINYPNDFDRALAVSERRRNLGGNIFIHGKNVSSGCLAVGDNAVEELFVLSSLIGKEAVSVIISPKDFRSLDLSSLPEGLPQWSYYLNGLIAQRLKAFPLSETLN